MKIHRDALAVTLSLVLGVAALASVLATDLYAQAASAEALGTRAMFETVALEQCAPGGVVPPLLAVSEARA